MHPAHQRPSRPRISKQNAGRSNLILQARRCQAELPESDELTGWIPVRGNGQSVKSNLASSSGGRSLGAGRVGIMGACVSSLEMGAVVVGRRDGMLPRCLIGLHAQLPTLPETVPTGANLFALSSTPLTPLISFFTSSIASSASAPGF